jgi:hypothetical protein
MPFYLLEVAARHTRVDAVEILEYSWEVEDYGTDPLASAAVTETVDNSCIAGRVASILIRHCTSLVY